MLREERRAWARTFDSIAELGEQIDELFYQTPSLPHIRLQVWYAISIFVDKKFQNVVDVPFEEFTLAFTSILLYRSSRFSKCLAKRAVQSDVEFQHLIRGCVECLKKNKDNDLLFTILENVDKESKFSICTLLLQSEPWTELCSLILSLLKCETFKDAIPFLNVLRDICTDDLPIFIITGYPLLRLQYFNDRKLIETPHTRNIKLHKNILSGVYQASMRRRGGKTYVVAFDIETGHVVWGFALSVEYCNIQYMNKHMVVLFDDSFITIDLETGQHSEHKDVVFPAPFQLLPTFDKFLVPGDDHITIMNLQNTKKFLQCKTPKGRIELYSFGAIFFDCFAKKIECLYFDQTKWMKPLTARACQIVDGQFMWVVDDDMMRLFEFEPEQLVCLRSIQLPVSCKDVNILFCDRRSAVLYMDSNFYFVGEERNKISDTLSFLPSVLGNVVLEYLPKELCIIPSSTELEYNRVACSNCVWMNNRITNTLQHITSETGVQVFASHELSIRNLFACTETQVIFQKNTTRV